MRDPSLLVYFRPESGGLIMGGYERRCAPWGLDGIPGDFNWRLLEEDWPRFEELMENAIVRVPTLGEMEVVKLINGPEAFTPDGEFILGPSEVRGFWVAAGFCAHGLAGAGGMGSSSPSGSSRGRRRSTSGTWTRAGSAPPIAPRVHAGPHDRDLQDLLRRQVPGAGARGRAAAARLAGLRAAGRSSAPRSARSRAGSGRTGSSRTRPRRRVAAPAGLGGKALVARDRRRARRVPRAAALFDETSFAKIEVAGEGAADFLERLCANRVARDVGRSPTRRC